MSVSWKIKRELERFGRQISALKWSTLGTLNRNHYDRTRATKVLRTQGARPLAPAMAVYLIYQPQGLLASSLRLLQELSAQGIESVVVSNAPLDAKARAQLQPRCHLIIERPNMGYDFGGYREGVLTLLDCAPSLDELYIMNDSIWFPLQGLGPVIARCRTAPEPVFGLNVSQLANRTKWNTHLQSYFYRFKAEVLRDPFFRSYWQKMLLINFKHAVIRRYERRLSREFSMQGYAYAGHNSVTDISSYILALQDDEKLRRYFEFQAKAHPAAAAYLNPLLEGGKTGREIKEALSFEIETHRIFNSIYSAHPALQLEIGLPFLKKGRSPDLILQRRALLEMGLEQAYAPEIAAELKSWDK